MTHRRNVLVLYRETASAVLLPLKKERSFVQSRDQELGDLVVIHAAPREVGGFVATRMVLIHERGPLILPGALTKNGRQEKPDGRDLRELENNIYVLC